jgi:hypothetical protein
VIPFPEAEAMTIPENVKLDPTDWFLAGWRNLPPLPLPPVEPYDREGCLKRLGKARYVSSTPMHWDWKQIELTLAMSPEEASFWLWSMVRAKDHLGARDLAGQMRRHVPDKPPSIDDMTAGLASHGVIRIVGPELAPVLCSAFGMDGFIRTYFGLWPIEDPQRRQTSFSSASIARQIVCAGFLRYVRPYLSREQLQPLQEMVRPSFRSRFEKDRWVPSALATLARALDMHEEIAMLVSSWPDGSGGSCFVLYGLPNADAVQQQMARLAIRMGDGEDVRGFLAHSGNGALTTIRDHILTRQKEAAEEMTEVFSLVESVAMAPLMLELIQAGKGNKSARRWLDSHPELAITGLLPLTGERNDLGEAALGWLTDAARAGHAALIESKLADATHGVERIRKALRGIEEAAALVINENALPEWLTGNLAEGKSKLPAWLEPATVTPIALQGRTFAAEQMAGVLGVLKDSTLQKPGPLVEELKNHVERPALEAFAWDLFERWLNAGAPPKDKWAMTVLGLLGGDGVCLKLWPYIRDWPGQSQHKRAVHGLECLRAIGSEQALLQLNKVAEKVRYPGLKRQAQEFMQEIAQERRLTPAQLEDRIVPDLGLDEQGMRLFDYGPRRFRVGLGPDMKPRILEDSGAIRGDLPKPNAKDDAVKSGTAQAEWKLFKQQLKEVLKAQSERLEKSMSRRRRWSVEEFTTWLIRHPFMRYLARVLLWAQFDRQGKVQSTFRVTEDDTFADRHGEPVSLDPNLVIGVVHPVLLSPEDLERWTEVFADHEILPPFPQLGRKMFKLGPEEENEKVLRRFTETIVPGLALAGATKKTGWEQGPFNSSARTTSHYKHFPEAGVTAFVTYKPGLAPFEGYRSTVEDQELEAVYFIAGAADGSKTPPADQAVPLREVDVLVLNEVAGLMFALSRKG